MLDNIQPFNFPDKSVFTTKMRVRFNDVNLGNHLDYAALLEMAGNARSQFFRSNHCTELDIGGVGIITQKLYVEYVGEGHLDDLLEFKIYLTDINGARANMLFSVKNVDTEKEIARICLGLLFYDYERKKVSRVSSKFLELAG
ncbi:MAG TPA: thioesterase family protein [Gammaproteobacteria bacterium]|nr:thioesterase family protein [Gammaproteobacteria bacterium]